MRTTGDDQALAFLFQFVHQRLPRHVSCPERNVRVGESRFPPNIEIVHLDEQVAATARAAFVALKSGHGRPRGYHCPTVRRKHLVTNRKSCFRLRLPCPVIYAEHQDEFPFWNSVADSGPPG
jgi:hypothetical protein